MVKRERNSRHQLCSRYFAAKMWLACHFGSLEQGMDILENHLDMWSRDLRPDDDGCGGDD